MLGAFLQLFALGAEEAAGKDSRREVEPAAGVSGCLVGESGTVDESLDCLGRLLEGVRWKARLL